nr:PqqD family protein [Halomonas olivaria]
MRLVDASHLLPVLRQAMPGWRFTHCEPQEKAPDVCVWQHPDGFWQEAPALPDGMLLDTPTGTACSVIADVAGAYLHQHRELIGLHCGSVEINGQLVIFPDTHRAGKSTLTAAFAAAGYRVYGDDVLAVNSDGEGVALGIAPRLRLPLPEQLSPVFHQFVADHLGPHDDRYGYLALNEHQLATHGTQCPVGGILLFDRDEGLAQPQLTVLQPGEGLWQLLRQNFAEHKSDQALIQRFLPMLQRLPCFLLRYSDAYEAAQWVGKQWVTKQLPSDIPHCNAVVTPQSSRVVSPSGQELRSLNEDDSRLWVASAAAHEFPLGDELFVIAQEGGAIHRLNITSRAVWALLQHEPIRLEEICETLLAFFDGASSADVRRDVAGLLSQLMEEGLIQEA